MVRPSLRSTSFRKVRMTIPGGASVIRYTKKSVSGAACAGCGARLAGVSGGRSSEVRAMSRGRKTVNRPFGGNLCSSCTRERIKRAMHGKA